MKLLLECFLIDYVSWNELMEKSSGLDNQKEIKIMEVGVT